MPKAKKKPVRKTRRKAVAKKPNSKPVAKPKMHPIAENELEAMLDFIRCSRSDKTGGEIVGLVAVISQVAQRPMPGVKK